MELREITLPSGRKMEVVPAPFAEAKRLYQAFASEMKKVDLKSMEAMDVNSLKNAICAMVESSAMEAALWPCVIRCTYQGQKITAQTFEPLEAREDFMDIYYEVAQENIAPFLKGLFAQFQGFLGSRKGVQL